MRLDSFVLLASSVLLASVTDASNVRGTRKAALDKSDDVPSVTDSHDRLPVKSLLKANESSDDEDRTLLHLPNLLKSDHLKERQTLFKPFLTNEKGEAAALMDILQNYKLGQLLDTFNRKKKDGISVAQLVMEHFEEEQVTSALIENFSAGKKDDELIQKLSAGKIDDELIKQLKAAKKDDEPIQKLIAGKKYNQLIQKLKADKKNRDELFQDLMKELFQRWPRNKEDDKVVFHKVTRTYDPEKPTEIFGGRIPLLEEYIKATNNRLPDFEREFQILRDGLGREKFLSTLSTNYESLPEAQRLEKELYKYLAVKTAVNINAVDHLVMYGDLKSMGEKLTTSPVLDMLERFYVRYQQSQNKLMGPFTPNVVTKVGALREGFGNDEVVALLLSKAVRAEKAKSKTPGDAAALKNEFLQQLSRNKEAQRKFIEKASAQIAKGGTTLTKEEKTLMKSFLEELQMEIKKFEKEKKKLEKVKK